jgi:signal transduction histidine kinase
MLGVLRDEPEFASEPGLSAGDAPLAPPPGLGDLPTLVERVRGTGLDVTVEESGRPFAVSGAAGLSLYRIVQEALTNALKHAEGPGSVAVRLSFDDPDISVRVTDDGAPAALSDGADAAGGHGLPGMAERAAAFGGTLQAGPRQSGGWEVVATLHDCRAAATA